MVHDDRTYLDDEGLEYEKRALREETRDAAGSPAQGPEGRLWGAHDAYGGYDAE